MTDTASNHEEPKRPDTPPALGRSARVNRRPDGEPIGATIFLNAEQLAELGFRIANTDSLAYSVENGRLRLVRTESSSDVPENTDLLRKSF